MKFSNLLQKTVFLIFISLAFSFSHIKSTKNINKATPPVIKTIKEKK